MALPTLSVPQMAREPPDPALAQRLNFLLGAAASELPSNPRLSRYAPALPHTAAIDGSPAPIQHRVLEWVPLAWPFALAP
jgi:hypothetical protein